MSNSEDEDEDESEYKYTIEVKDGFTMSSDEPIFIIENGRKIYDEDSIKMIMRKRLAENSTESAKKEEKKLDFDAKDIVKEQIREDDLDITDIEYTGSVSVYEKKSYSLTIVNENGKKEAYIAHLVEIGQDLFMDLYPVKEFDSKNISDNFFPVHTFYKVRVTKNKFTMIHFDLEKLNDLFESNLIRLRHENVEGTVLITAQPKELQKFLDKYADDESVFGEVIDYSKAI